MKKLGRKMRTGNTIKIITITLVIIALMSATAFAYVGKPTIESEVSGHNYFPADISCR